MPRRVTKVVIGADMLYIRVNFTFPIFAAVSSSVHHLRSAPLHAAIDHPLLVTSEAQVYHMFQLMNTQTGTDTRVIAATMSTSSEANDSTRYSMQDTSSTYLFSGLSPPHEAFETFQHKVIALTHSICDVEEVTVRRIRGGSYNRVVVAHIKVVDQGELSGIFRIPRDRDIPEGIERNSSEDIDADILNQVAVLQLLQSRSIPAPVLLAYDSSGQNPIKSPYVFQHFSQGKLLEVIYTQMAFEEKMQVAESLADFLARMESVIFEKSGIVVAAQTSAGPPSTKASKFSNALENTAIAVRGFTDPYDNVHTFHSATRPRELISQLLNARLDGEMALGKAPNEVTQLFCKLLEMLEEMCSLGVFGIDHLYRQTTVLYHWDLEPRNILVKTIELPASEEQPREYRLKTCPSIEASLEAWVIDVAVDWDQVQAVPPVLARRPPIWLWDFDTDTSDHSLPPRYDNDSDLQPATRYDSSKGVLSLDSRQIQKRFEDRLVRNLQQIYPTYTAETYRDEAYGRGRWIRRMARFAIRGLRSSEDWKRFEGLEKEWSTARFDFSVSANNGSF
ncbi:hypothetical protein CERZMDRAFT_88361 [Cercospora zeae-maydis SCOH1-5]|uniref:Uncharacterized protein n=1 Tax=Cercospora zeae-maydis SCOH1-5 TaxID=717836 RepID=A0A6A6F2M6_9PEZI|nr:hypothetical protein CERZMDRAFT_88361 [Cercospora zeae-maydis SCOH1-5]